MSDGIIDLGEYLRRRDGTPDTASTFSLWGADGERSRFALPLWRAIYLAQADRGGILWGWEGAAELQPFVVLDLGADPPRIVFDWDGATELDRERAPELRMVGESGLAIYLGSEAGREWFLLVAGGTSGEGEPVGRDREDMLFLAGECAGLLFLRDFADEADAP